MNRSRRLVLLLFLVLVPVVVALGIGLLAVNRFAGPLPPRRLSISTGREGGAYHLFAQEYRKLLADQGFALDIEPGPGSVATLRRLVAGEVTVGFAQGGTAAGAEGGRLRSLGSVFYEPLWVFHRKTQRVTYLSDLRGKRLAVGEEGSGTRSLALLLLAENQVTAENSTFLALSSDAAAEQLEAGRIDAGFFVISPRAGLVLRLLRHPGIDLMSERRHLAYESRHAFLTSITIGEGMLDVVQNLPAQEKTVLAVAANLVARDDIHPDHVRLLLGAATRVHQRGGLLEREGAFPSERLTELPIDEGARRYLRQGPTWLERLFPFWIAGLLDRLLIILLPVVGLLLPFFNAVRPFMDRRRRLKIARWYETLRDVDLRIDTMSAAAIDAEIARLRALQREITERTKLPALYMGELYNLKMHVELLLDRLAAQRRTLHADPTPR